MDRPLAKRIVDLLNDLVSKDRPAIAALIANRVPCNQAIADHPTVIVSVQNGGYHVGLLGILNGLVESNEKEAIAAVFDDPKEGSPMCDLRRFEVVELKK